MIGRPPESDEDHRLTQVLQQLSPAWAWVRANFSAPAVLTLAGVIAAAGSYIVSLKTRVIVLETEVTHIVKVVPDETQVAILRARVDDHEQRITRLEGDWDHAQQYAALPPKAPRLVRRRGAR